MKIPVTVLSAVLSMLLLEALSPSAHAFIPRMNKRLTPSTESRLQDDALLKTLGFVDKDNQRVFLKDYIGNVIILNIWASWSFSCQSQSKALTEFMVLPEARHTQIITLSLDTDPQKFTDYVKNQHLSAAINGYMNDHIQAALALSIIPVTFILRNDLSVAHQLNGVYPAEDIVGFVQKLIPAGN